MKAIPLVFPLGESGLLLELVERQLTVPTKSPGQYWSRLEAYALYQIRDALIVAIGKARRKDLGEVNISLHPILVDVFHSVIREMPGVEVADGELMRYSLMRK